MNGNEVLGVHVVLDWELSTKHFLGAVFVEESLGLDILSGEFVLVEWDFTGLSNGDEAGSKFEHNFVEVCLTINYKFLLAWILYSGQNSINPCVSSLQSSN